MPNQTRPSDVTITERAYDVGCGHYRVWEEPYTGKRMRRRGDVVVKDGVRFEVVTCRITATAPGQYDICTELRELP